MLKTIENKETKPITKSSDKLFSFDIFDTLVTRLVVEPVGIFSIMQHKLEFDSLYNNFPIILRQNFYDIRTEAEKYARVRKKYLDENSQDITLEDIYHYIGENYNLDNAQKNILMELEIQTEIDNLVPINKNIDTLKEIIENKERVVLISDMYHSEAVIRRMLCSIDDIFKDIKIYVSNEYNKTKASGDLYKYVQQEENIDCNNWLHFGDNIESDINMAKSLQINATHKPQIKLKAYERYLMYCGVCINNNCFNQGIVGCARYTRMSSRNKSRAYQFGCSFAAPILYQYVNWIIEQAISHNLKTLHFVARDGYILKLIAEEIVEKKGLDIKLNYIFGSRKAWRLPTEDTFEDFINYMLSEYLNFLTPQFFASRLNMKKSDIEKYYGEKLPNRILTLDEIKNLKDKLLQNPEFKKDIINLYSDKVNILREYFKQEFGEDDNIALVDLYGSGRTQDMLRTVLYGKNSNKTIYSFYVSMTSSCPEDKHNKKLSFFSNIKYNDFWLELFCRTTYGQTIGYKKSEDKIVPIIEDVNVQNILNWGYESYKQGLIDYTKNIIEFENRNKISTSSLGLYIKYHHFYRNRLDKDTASIIGDIPYALVGDETNVSACAPEFTNKDYITMLITGNSKYRMPLSFVSFRRSDAKFGRLYSRNKRCEDLIKHIKDDYISKIFYITDSLNKMHKELHIFGIKIKFKAKN